MSALPALAFVYLDGGEVYVHPAVVAPATAAHAVYGAECHAECGTPIVVGQMLLTTDWHEQGEATGHLACLLATGGFLMTMWEAERVQAEQRTGHHEAL